MKRMKMYKLTVQSYSKENSDLFLVNEIKTIRNNSGLMLKVNINDNWIIVFDNYKGEYNPYHNSTTFNSLTCTDEFKEFANYDSNFISFINIEFIKN